MFVGSIAAYAPGPNMAAYYASKAYLRSLSNALYAETKGSGVIVTNLSPGFVSTPSLTLSGIGATRLRKILPRMTDGVFLENFLRKGRFAALLRRVPIFLVQNPELGLLGAASLAAGL